MSIDFELTLKGAIRAYQDKYAKVARETRALEEAVAEGEKIFRDRIWGLIAESVQRASVVLAVTGGVLENVRSTKADPRLTYIARLHLQTGTREMTFSHMNEGMNQFVEVSAPGCEQIASGQPTALNRNYPINEFGRDESDQCVLEFCRRALEQL